jgi:hypothetical protein
VGWTNDLMTGLGELLAAAGVGQWNPDGVYADGDIGITVGVLPQTPEQVICLTPYPVDDRPGMVDVTVGMQIRCRGTADPRVVQDLADAVYDALHGATPGTVHGIQVAQVFWQSGAPLGADQLGRWERSENYYAQASRPNLHNTN